MDQRTLYSKLADSTEFLEQSYLLDSYISTKQDESIGQAEDFSKIVVDVNEKAIANDTVAFIDRLSAASDKNNEIIGNRIFEEKQRSINELYLEKLTKDGVLSFTESEIEFINKLAHECVFTSGNAVYLARSLYALANPEEIISDDLICNNSFKQEEVVSTKKTFDLRVFPNPANETLIVGCDLTGYAQAFFHLVEINGKEVYSKSTDNQAFINTINLSRLEAGVYYLKITVDNEVIGSKKIVVVH